MPFDKDTFRINGSGIAWQIWLKSVVAYMSEVKTSCTVLFTLFTMHGKAGFRGGMHSMCDLSKVAPLDLLGARSNGI